MLRAAVPLGSEQGELVGLVGDGPFEQEDVRLLAGLEDTEVGVDRGVCGDDPLGSGFGAAHALLDAGPRGPALVGVGVLREVAVEGVERVEAGEAREVRTVDVLVHGGAPRVR
ncbi:hypothetical protein NKG05_29480 [Oerskovia sp. M15]